MEKNQPRRGYRYLTVAGSVAFLVGTTSGLHLVFKAADRWVPGLDVGKVTGGWRDLTLSDVRYEQPGVAVKQAICIWRSGLSACGTAVFVLMIWR